MHLCFCEEEDYELSLSKLFSEYSKEQSEVGYFEGENNIVMVDGDSLYKDGNIVAKKKGKNVWGWWLSKSTMRSQEGLGLD